MYKISKDYSNLGRYKIQYELEVGKNFYEILNLEWQDVSKFIKPTVNNDDADWMFDLVRLSGARIDLKDSGDWAIA